MNIIIHDILEPGSFKIKRASFEAVKHARMTFQGRDYVIYPHMHNAALYNAILYMFIRLARTVFLSYALLRRF